MKLIATKDAVGHVLCHDMTQIVRGVTKDARFRKGHIVTEEDIPVLLSMGKESLYVWEKQEGMLHEDEAAQELWAMVKSPGLRPQGPKEGKIDVYAETDGLLKVDAERLRLVNRAGRMMIATRHGNTTVHAGDKVAGTRIIPLIIEAEALKQVREQVGPEPLLRIMPWQLKTYGIVTTGSEVYKGRIKDTFTPVVQAKLEDFDLTMKGHVMCSDDDRMVTAAILDLKAQGCDLIVCTGGMSVDPDDKTPLAIKNTGANIITYGAPLLPGAMFLLSYLDGTPVLGLPGCVMYAASTVFDVMLPRVIAGDPITADEIADLGEGGLCLGCSDCRFPDCGFGK
ncbi:MAG: molybdopterin-binding protein [Firmicutes bacterium]|nr:molybdopterin-binding protein [Bacillota bacterium]